MGATAEKLTYLNTTKQNLKTVINTTGAGLTDESTFRSYANVLNDKILGAINGDVDLFEEYPKVSGNGTDLSLNGVVEGKMAITPQGASSQDGEPTPTTPIQVKSVTGENSLVISNSDNTETQSYSISLGNIELNSSPDGTIRDQIKGSSDVSYNLFDGARKNVYFNSQKQFASGVADALTTNYIPASEGDIFTISTELASGGIVIASFDKNKVCISRSAVGTSSLSLTYTCPANTKYIIGSNFIGMTTNTTLVKGSEAKPYFPYGQVGMWYKREYIGKVVLNGSETIQYTSANNRFDFNVSNVKPGSSGNPNVISDNYTGKYSFDNYSIFSTRIGNQIAIIDNRFTNVNDFKTWLSTHNTTVWYQKSQYTDIPITDTTLINQLNDIYNNAHSYNGVTNITTTYEDGNEQMYLDIEALKNVWEVTE